MSVMLISSHSGLRGRPGIDLTAEVVDEAIAGLVELLRRRGVAQSLGVARDERPGGQELAEAVIAAARASGVDVTDFGIASTPALKLASKRLRLGGAVMVTGSHLDADHNGLKPIAAPTYGPVDPSGLPGGSAVHGGYRGSLRSNDGAERTHVAAVCESVDEEVIRHSGMSVGYRGGAGPGPELLLERLGCNRSGPSDATLCFDADGDRLQLLGRGGASLDAELTLPLVAVARRPRKIVKSADTSRIVEAVAVGSGASVTVAPPGEMHIFDAMQATGADLAGEGNGGVIVPSVGPGRDGLAAGAAILWLMACREQSLDALAAELPRHALVRSSVACTDSGSGLALLDRVALRMGVVAHDRRWGVHVGRGAHAWGLVRLSATEPLIRITAEAPERPEAEALHRELAEALREAKSDS